MSSGVYVPRAKLLALQAEAEQTQNGSLATPPPTPAETATTSYSEEEIASWPEARRYFYNSSNTFRELQNAKKAFNENPDVEEMFNKNRAHSSDQPISKTFADQFYTCMNDIDTTAGNVLSNGDISRYLDLGCSPGGFSTWVMSKNPKSKGLGITLPVEMAGLPMVSFPEGNYTVKYRDVTRLDDVERELREADMGRLDLVMAACIYRDHETTKPRDSGQNEAQTPNSARSILSLSQIHIALKHLRQGGHFVFVLSNKPDPATLQTLVLLRQLFESLTPCKGKSLHGIRSSFYLFSESFDRAKYEESKIEELLLKAMAEMREEEDRHQQAEIERIANRTDNLQLEGGEKATDEDQMVHAADKIWLPDWTMEDLLEKEGPFVKDFFDTLWQGQIRAIGKRTDELKYGKTRSSGMTASGGWRGSSRNQPGGEGGSWRTKAPEVLLEAPSSVDQSGWQTTQTSRRGGSAPKVEGSRVEPVIELRQPSAGASRNDWRKR